MKRLFKKLFYKYRAKKVGEYYDNWSRKLLEVTDTFQGFRTEKIEDFHEYTIKSACLESNMKILDAGCGVGGPAFYFAKKLDSQIFALTISKVQAEIILERKQKEGLDNIHQVLGDYHNVKKIFCNNFFDSILFLESLGHSYHPEKALQQCFYVLKPGKCIYIRDHYIVEGKSEEEKSNIERLVAEGNETYVYNHITLDYLLQILTKIGFEIIFQRKPVAIFYNINPELERQLNIRSPNGYFIDTIEIKAMKPIS